jgi:hypothetical protein
VLVPLGRMGGQVGVDLGLQGGGQHPPGALASQLVQILVQLRTRAAVATTLSIAASPSSPARQRRFPLAWSSRRVRRALVQGAGP